MLILSTVCRWHSACGIMDNPIYVTRSVFIQRNTSSFGWVFRVRMFKSTHPLCFGSLHPFINTPWLKWLLSYLYMSPVLTFPIKNSRFSDCRTSSVHSASEEAKSTWSSTVSTFKALTIVWVQMRRDAWDFSFSQWWLPRVLYSGRWRRLI